MEEINKTIGEFLTENKDKYKDRTAVMTRDWSCSARELDEITDLLAVYLHENLDIRKGVHVGIWSVNTPEFLFLFFAMIKSGAVPIPLNTCYREEEISEILNAMDIEVLFYGKGWKDLVYEDMMPRIRTLSPKVRETVPIHSLYAGAHMSASDLQISEDGKAWLALAKKSVSSQDTACIMMTSGTTLSPKGVMLSHRNIVNDGLWASRWMHWNDQNRILLTLPFFHCFGLITGAVGAVLNGMEMFVLPHFATKAVWEAIDDFGCTVLNGVPSVFLALIRKEEYHDRKGPGLKSGIIGGSVLRTEDYLDICSHFPNMNLQPSYGMTEASPSVSFPRWGTPLEKKALSCGLVMDEISCRIADIHTGEILPAGKTGEIQLSGINITSGYYNHPEETKKAFTSDGYLKTGDLGYLNEEGELFITGRLKELIIRAGENISVAEIENAILNSGFVSEVKVVGVSSDFRQEEIAALIVPDFEMPDSETLDPEAADQSEAEALDSETADQSEAGKALKERLLTYLKEKLAVYKIPDTVIIVSSLPVTGSGKTDLKACKKLAENYVHAR